MQCERPPGSVRLLCWSTRRSEREKTGSKTVVAIGRDFMRGGSVLDHHSYHRLGAPNERPWGVNLSVKIFY
jgi:hypothetical protein